VETNGNGSAATEETPSEVKAISPAISAAATPLPVGESDPSLPRSAQSVAEERSRAKISSGAMP